MILFLDTSEFRSVTCAIITSAKILQMKFKLKNNDSQQSFVYLKKFLSAHKKEWKKIEKIIVVSGPGSFSGIRAGLANALALGFAWNAEVLAIKKELVPAKISDLLKFKKSHLKKVTQSFKPEYGAEPNITMGVKDNENF